MAVAQVYTVEEQRMLAQLNVEEARKREQQMMAQFRRMIAERTKANATSAKEADKDAKD